MNVIVDFFRDKAVCNDFVGRHVFNVFPYLRCWTICCKDIKLCACEIGVRLYNVVINCGRSVRRGL